MFKLLDSPDLIGTQWQCTDRKVLNLDHDAVTRQLTNDGQIAWWAATNWGVFRINNTATTSRLEALFQAEQRG